MAATREIVVTQASNGHYWARYADHDDIGRDPAGYGHTRAQALANLTVDETYIEKHGPVEEQIDLEG